MQLIRTRNMALNGPQTFLTRNCRKVTDVTKGMTGEYLRSVDAEYQFYGSYLLLPSLGN